MTQASRLVVVGRNSAVWGRLEAKFPALATDALLLSHSDLGVTVLGAADVVWILSYSRDPDENRAMFELLREMGAGRHIYVSTATANVAQVTRCFAYPRAKADAEALALGLLNAHTVRIGIVYDDLFELPGGCNAATALAQIGHAMAHPHDVPRQNLFSMIDRPFRSKSERALFRLYGLLLSFVEGFPCVLRPVDALLRAAGLRWYGYLYLSNRLWLREGGA